MKVGISIVEVQSVKMVKVRDLAHPEQFALAPLAPEGTHTDLDDQEQVDAAVAQALKQLREKKAASR